MAQITSVVSEPLQAKIRSLLPSQAGFTEDLQAQNVIVPIIDLTETASGSLLREDLQKSSAFVSSTEILVSNAVSTIISTTGFFELIGTICCVRATNDTVGGFSITDGATSKVIYQLRLHGGANTTSVSESFKFIVFLRSGDSLTCNANSAEVDVRGSFRQIADLSGNLVNPSGYTGE